MENVEDVPWTITTRRVAAINRQTKYYTGKKCVHGHTSQRYTSTGICIKCSRINSQKYRSLLAGGKTNSVAIKTFVHADDEETVLNLIAALKQARELTGGNTP